MKSTPTVLDRFISVCHNFGDEVAIDQDGIQITYTEFLSKVNLIATKIVSQCREIPHPRVLIVLPQGITAYASMFATLLAGGTYAPISSDAPIDRIRRSAIIFEPDVIINDSDSDWIPASMSSRLLKEYPPDDVSSFFPRDVNEIAYTIFTSGSTGEPKGVEVFYNGLSSYIEWAIQTLRIGPKVRCSQHPNISFDLSVLDIYATLCSGGTLVPILSLNERLFPAKAILERQIDVWISVPSVVDVIRRSKQDLGKYLSAVKTFLFCGEPLLPIHVESLFSSAPEARVFNTYGPTEATVSCTAIELEMNSLHEHTHQSITIGEPIGEMELHLENGPNDDEGEIVIYGVQVAAGYLNNEDLTSHKFGIRVSDRKRFYRTGDWAKRVNGHIYVVGRTDRQIKLNGYRIELGDIDSAIRELLPDASVASVFRQKMIVSFIQFDGVLPLNIRELMGSSLPQYMIPARIVPVTMMPYTLNDKIDYLTLENYDL